MFAFWWDGIDLFSMIEKLLRFIQARRKKWDKITWNQIAEGKNETGDSEEGEAKAEYVEKIHLPGERDSDRLASLSLGPIGYGAKGSKEESY